MSVVVFTIDALRDFLGSSNVSRGLVPTMGSLHDGHLSLIEQAKLENDCVVVSIFVNPLQFGQGEDYLIYPRNLESDRQVCLQAEVNIIFAPTPAEIYGEGALTKIVPPDAMTAGLCGRSRVGHFTGVATVVAKLFNIVRPHRAYFGQKDGQQLSIIRQLVKDLNFAIEVRDCPTLRMASGLALSSRNQYLDSEQLGIAASLYESLKLAESAFLAGEIDSKVLIYVVKSYISPQIVLEYVELVDAETLEPVEKVVVKSMLAIAGRVGYTRLIDNIILNVDRSRYQ
jgi:pantoate ligase / CMP/dCMP kinase